MLCYFLKRLKFVTFMSDSHYAISASRYFAAFTEEFNLPPVIHTLDGLLVEKIFVRHTLDIPNNVVFVSC